MIPTLHADPDSCPVVVGMADNATQDVLVCGQPVPCEEHDVPWALSGHRLVPTRVHRPARCIRAATSGDTGD
jgi:hypothetical protein